MKNIRILLLSLLCCALSTNIVLANDLERYTDDEGAVLVKMRGSYLYTKAKLNDFSRKAENNIKIDPLTKNGYGIGAATVIFFNRNLAVELSADMHAINVDVESINAVSSGFGDGSGSKSKNDKIYQMPVAATIQYHIAPFGGIRPYIGCGYHLSYIYAKSKSINLDLIHGALLQVGVDFIAKDDTFITFDVKQYFSNPKITFKRNLFSSTNSQYSDLSAKSRLNPLIISFGVGWSF